MVYLAFVIIVLKLIAGVFLSLIESNCIGVGDIVESRVNPDVKVVVSKTSTDSPYFEGVFLRELDQDIYVCPLEYTFEKKKFRRA